MSPSGPREDRRTQARIARLLFAVLALPQEQQSVIAPCLSLQGGGGTRQGVQLLGQKSTFAGPGDCWVWPCFPVELGGLKQVALGSGWERHP